MHRLLLILGIVCTLSATVQAQQNNLWYFGHRAGLDFTPVPGQPLPRALNNSNLTANEGTSSICSPSGQLLFYSNGVTVYNRDHAVMQNGDGLMGNNSSVQSSIIVPIPGNDSIYYIFTTDAIENDYANGYRYSKVNMKLDGGRGAVIEKNTLLSASCTERLVAARHANGLDVWILTNDNNSNTFRAWLVNCEGLQPGAVVSTVGTVLNTHALMNTGMLRVSPDGKQICQTHFADVDINAPPNFLQLFDFNNLTGSITNARSISVAGARFNSCEYSPDSKLLYLTSPSNNSIYQVESKLPTAAEISASSIRINTPGATFYGIQLGPDGKIYLAQPSQHLSVINSPNVKAPGCNYEKDKVSLAPGAAFLGLPAFINDLSADPNNGFDFLVVDSCTGRIQFNAFTTMSGTILWEWDFGDGHSSTQQNPVHVYADPSQVYVVTLIIKTPTACGYIEKGRPIFPGGISAQPLFDQVTRCDSGFVRFTNNSIIAPDSAGTSWLWNFGDGNTSTEKHPVHSYPGGGGYTVTLTIKTSTPCLDRSLVKNINVDKLDIQVPADMSVEAFDPVQLDVFGGGIDFVWTPSAGLSDDSIRNPVAIPPKSMQYKVVARNEAGCEDSDSLYITVNPFPGIYVPTGFTPNNDGLNDVFRPIISKEYTLHEFTLYNRWGEKIFTTKQKGAGWNGRLNGLEQNAGVFIWIVRATDERNGELHSLKGTFILLR